MKSQRRQNFRWAVFISGRGSNLAALIQASVAHEIALVVSSSDKAYGLLRAKRAGIPTLVLSKPIDWSDLSKQLHKRGVERVFLAGFMKVVPRDFVAEWQERIFNVHPSLLPTYPGLKSIERAFVDRADIGVTVHEVNEEVDAGKIVLQRRALSQDDYKTEPTILESELRVHAMEHRLVRELIPMNRRRDLV